MDNEPAAGGGILESIRSLADGLLAGLQDRIALVSIELQEEVYRKIRTLVWVCALVFAGTMALIFASLTLVYMFWESARLTVLGSLAGAYLAGFVVIGIAFRRFLARQPRPFAATLESLEADRQCIRNEK